MSFLHLAFRLGNKFIGSPATEKRQSRGRLRCAQAARRAEWRGYAARRTTIKGTRMLWYVIASLTPALLIAAAALWGGVWPVLALLSITVHVAFMDRLGRAVPLSERSGRALTLALAVAHLLGVLSLKGIFSGGSNLEGFGPLLLSTVPLHL